MASRKAAPTTAISAAPAITRCSCSTSSAIWSAALCGRATSTAPTAGVTCWSRWSRATGARVKRRYFRGDAAFANPEIYEFLEAEGIRIHDPAAGQSGLAGKHRLSAQAPGRATAARGAPLLRQLQLSGAELEQAAPRRGQGRMASGRALSARRLHRHQPGAPGRARRRLLQSARHLRAVDQGRQERDQVDAAVMLLLRRQRRPASASCAGLQSRQLHADAGDAGDGQSTGR